MIHMNDTFFSFFLKILTFIVYIHGPGFHEDVYRGYKIYIESFSPMLVFFIYLESLTSPFKTYIHT